MGAPVRILVVCTGNICRSPAAERLLRDRLSPLAHVHVSSAGTRAVVGAPVSPPMGDLLRAADIEVGDFAARQLDERVVSGIDLLLGLTRPHRAASVRLAPALVRRAFTLRELARLVPQVTLPPGDEPPADTGGALAGGDPRDAGTARLRGLIGAAARLRSPVPEELDAIRDPYLKGDAAYQVAYTEIVEAVDAIAAAVRAV